ncbi:MAG: Ribulose-1,5-bisphosphate carboxylase/oxygenase large subunit [Acidimicrobiaceae bacterium]|nr:MAG: Ribulose-1,5-bisphosphate carboxylase/oxygenase large subunit [Acidimicrobiaceae bacterium]
MALAFAGLGLGLLHGLGHVLEAMPPPHERLRVHVLVILGEVEPATQALVHGAAVVLGRQPELRFDRASEQRPAVLVELVAFDRDAVRWAAAGHHVVQREAHVFLALKPKTLPTSEVSTFTTDPSSNRSIG